VIDSGDRHGFPGHGGVAFGIVVFAVGDADDVQRIDCVRTGRSPGFFRSPHRREPNHSGVVRKGELLGAGNLQRKRASRLPDDREPRGFVVQQCTAELASDA